MTTKQLNHFKHFVAAICLLCLFSVNAFAQKETPFTVFSRLWQEQTNDNSEISLLTDVSSETLNLMYPSLKKALKVKNEPSFESTKTVGGVLTGLMKSKYGKKSNAKNDFYAIQYSTKSSDFEEYLSKYPDSQFADEVKARLDCFKENELWTKAKDAKSREAYEDFAKYCAEHTKCEYEGCRSVSDANHKMGMVISDWYALKDKSNGQNPAVYQDFSGYISQYRDSSPFIQEATDSMNLNRDRYDWKSASQENTPDAYKRYLKEHEDGLFVDKANEIVEELDWNTATAEGTAKAYRQYLSEHEDGKFVAKAESMLEELDLWEKAKASGQYKDYCDYYDEYPDGKFSDEAVEFIKQQETAAWTAAKKANTLKAYENFVKQYPNGYYSSDAQNKISELRLAPFLKTPPAFNSIAAISDYANPGYSLVGLGNVDNEKTITVSLNGPTGFSKSFKPGQFEWVRVKNGTYKILVQASNTNNWWGKALFENKVYADAWASSTEMFGVQVSNKNEVYLQRILKEVNNKRDEESIKALKYILQLDD